MALPCCKKLFALLRGITSEHEGDFYCVNCIHSYSTKDKNKKHTFYSSLNMEDNTDVDYRHAKRVFKNLNNKNLGDYHDL